MAKKILVVDDEPDLVKIIKMRLESNGYNTITASNGKDGLKKAIKESPDLVILDLGLPSGGGFFVLENIRKNRKVVQMRIIVSTANISADIEKKSRESGADSFILKPYDLEKLLEIIKANLSS